MLKPELETKLPGLDEGIRLEAKGRKLSDFEKGLKFLEGTLVGLVGEFCCGFTTAKAVAVFSYCSASGVRPEVFFCKERKILAVESSNWVCTTSAEYSSCR